MRDFELFLLSNVVLFTRVSLCVEATKVLFCYARQLRHLSIFKHSFDLQDAYDQTGIAAPPPLPHLEHTGKRNRELVSFSDWPTYNKITFLETFAAPKVPHTWLSCRFIISFEIVQYCLEHGLVGGIQVGHVAATCCLLYVVVQAIQVLPYQVSRTQKVSSGCSCRRCFGK